MKDCNLFVNVGNELVPVIWKDELDTVIDPYKDFKNKMKQQVRDYYNGRIAYFDDMTKGIYKEFNDWMDIMCKSVPINCEINIKDIKFIKRFNKVVGKLEMIKTKNPKN